MLGGGGWGTGRIEMPYIKWLQVHCNFTLPCTRSTGGVCVLYMIHSEQVGPLTHSLTSTVVWPLLYMQSTCGYASSPNQLLELFSSFPFLRIYIVGAATLQQGLPYLIFFFTNFLFDLYLWPKLMIRVSRSIGSILPSWFSTLEPLASLILMSTIFVEWFYLILLEDHRGISGLRIFHLESHRGSIPSTSPFLVCLRLYGDLKYIAIIIACLLSKDSEATVELELFVNRRTATHLNSGEDKLEDILVLHLIQGKDYFLSVSGNYMPSCFGSPIQTLCYMRDPIQEMLPEAIRELVGLYCQSDTCLSL